MKLTLVGVEKQEQRPEAAKHTEQRELDRGDVASAIFSEELVAEVSLVVRSDAANWHSDLDQVRNESMEVIAVSLLRSRQAELRLTGP
jgi:hypothetical protein